MSMASFLDMGVLGYFSAIFTFLLVFVVVFALLEYMKIFGAEAKPWHAIIAVAIAALALMSKAAMSFLGFVTPWFLVLFFVIFFIMFAIRMFGVGEKEFKEGVVSEAWPWILVFSIIIVLFGLGNALGQSSLEAGGGGTTVTSGSNDSGSSTDTVDTTTSSGDADASTSGVKVGQPGATATTSFSQNLYNTFFHPKVLGLFFLLVIATVTIAFMAQRP
jgi:hypothetical protein